MTKKKKKTKYIGNFHSCGAQYKNGNYIDNKKGQSSARNSAM